MKTIFDKLNWFKTFLNGYIVGEVKCITDDQKAKEKHDGRKLYKRKFTWKI